MTKPLALHLKAALVCGLLGVALALPLLWAPLLPGWHGWKPPLVSPRAEAVIAIVCALWVAWCVVDIPRRELKVLVWFATLWLLGSGIWLSGLYGFDASSLVPVTAAGLAGAAALAFSFSPAGSRRARWEKLVGPRVARDFLRKQIDESHLDDGPRSAIVAVVEVLWPGSGSDDHKAWSGLSECASRAGVHFGRAGAYTERCDAEGARFVFGLWGAEASPGAVVSAVWDWVRQAGGCAAVTRGECVAGVGNLPTGPRYTLAGVPLRRAARMVAAARGYAAGFVLEDPMANELGKDWITRPVAWWDFEGERVLLREVRGPGGKDDPAAAGDLRRWERAWEAFWSGDWPAAENGFAALAREREDATARIFAMRSEAARRGES